MYQKRLFLAVILMAGGVVAHPSGAAPAVKNFSGATSSSTYSNFNRGTPAKLSATTKGASSARALSLTTKPTAKASTAGNTSGTSVSTPKTTGYATSARLPGAHGNLFKGISSKLSTNYASQPGGGSNTSDLEQRIAALESEMNTKQDILESGDGIAISGNTISLDADLGALPERVDELSQAIDNLGEQTQEYMETTYYTKEEIDNVVGQLTPPNVVSEFDPGFLLNP